MIPFDFSSHVKRSRSNHSSQPSVLSPRYLMTASFDQYQTWCRGCPQWVDDPYWFSGRSRSNHSSQPFVLSAQYLLTLSLDQYQTWCKGCPQWVNGPYWFSGHMFKVDGQTTFLSPLCCPFNIFDPFTWSIPNLVQGLRPISRWSQFIFRSYVQRSRSNYLLSPVCCHFLYFNPLPTCFGQVLLQINLNFAPSGAYIFLKHFLFSK